MTFQFQSKPDGPWFELISASDMDDAANSTGCTHGKSNAQDCQSCWSAAVMHRQTYRMAQTLGLSPEDARAVADDQMKRQLGHMLMVGPVPAVDDVPQLPPIDLSEIGLQVVNAPLGTVFSRPDGEPLNKLQEALVDAISEGAPWVAGGPS